jgi:hypothetical protein
VPQYGNTEPGHCQPPLSSVRPNEPCEPGGHLTGDRTLEGGGGQGGPASVAIVRVAPLARAAVPRSALSELGPSPVHPPRCKGGEGHCVHCVAVAHWQHLKAICLAMLRGER